MAYRSDPGGRRRRAPRLEGGGEGASRWVIFRDLLLFQLKLFLDGLIDLALSPLSVVAAGIDIFFGGARRGRLFYTILRLGERADRWLNLYEASDRADADGLFGGSKAGSESYLGQLEQRIRGGDEPRGFRKRKPPPLEK